MPYSIRLMSPLVTYFTYCFYLLILNLRDDSTALTIGLWGDVDELDVLKEIVIDSAVYQWVVKVQKFLNLALFVIRDFKIPGRLTSITADRK